MARKSAGILLYRLGSGVPEVFLVHPGGPFFVKKDAGAWSIPKGEFTEEEDALIAALREFEEETGVVLKGNFHELKPVRQKSGKTVVAWSVEGDLDETAIRSNTFSLEWPPKSGKFKEFPEVDKAGWFTIAVAKQKILPAQCSFIDELAALLQERSV